MDYLNTDEDLFKDLEKGGFNIFKERESRVVKPSTGYNKGVEIQEGDLWTEGIPKKVEKVPKNDKKSKKVEKETRLKKGDEDEEEGQEDEDEGEDDEDGDEIVIRTPKDEEMPPFYGKRPKVRVSK